MTPIDALAYLSPTWDIQPSLRYVGPCCVYFFWNDTLWLSSYIQSDPGLHIGQQSKVIFMKTQFNDVLAILFLFRVMLPIEQGLNRNRNVFLIFMETTNLGESYPANQWACLRRTDADDRCMSEYLDSDPQGHGHWKANICVVTGARSLYYTNVHSGDIDHGWLTGNSGQNNFAVIGYYLCFPYQVLGSSTEI
jgi:hypothetical protein